MQARMNQASRIAEEERLIMRLLEVASKVERRIDRAISVIRGVSFSEYRLLRALSLQHAGTATRVDLAEAVGLTPSAVTRALKPLEKLGYVLTEKSERDARQSLARLTSAGEELLSDAQAVMRDVISGMPTTELDSESLAAFADKL